MFQLNAFAPLGPLAPGVPIPAGKNKRFLLNENKTELILVAPLMPNGLPATRATLQSQREITIANDLIGCIIGRGGQKISEIR